MEHIIKIVANTKEGVMEFLSDAILHDNDFNGENGKEYLWECAAGFDSNADYCLSEAEKKSTPKEMIKAFIDLWMGADSYYEDYDVEILQNDEILFISFVFVEAY